MFIFEKAAGEVGCTPIRLPPNLPPTLVLVIDTEEEFDWAGDFHRDATSVVAMRSAGRAQRVFDERGVAATWVVDYPVASQPAGYEPLLEPASSGRALIGAHLHPWVSPPFVETVDRRSSFAGNLPADLEREKLARLTERIEATFGRRPRVYKAGRYGFGPNTASILADLGYEVDLSSCPAFDFRAEAGPDYSRLGPEPFWIDADDGSDGTRGRARLLELPATGAFLGWLRPWGPRLLPLVEGGLWRTLRVPAVLSRLGALDRLHLSPEGYGRSDLRRLTRSLLSRGVRVVTLAFHSPSLEPGHTPYVRNEADLARFLDDLRSYLDFFLGDLGGRVSDPLELRRQLAHLPGGSDR